MRLLPLTLLCLSALPALSLAQAPRFHFAKKLELTAGETAGDLSMIAGQVTLNAQSQAEHVRVDNGGLTLQAGSKAASVSMQNGDLQIAGSVAGDVFCGIGSLKIEAPARIQGQVVNLGCDLQIGAGVEVAGDIISFADKQLIGPDLKLPGRVFVLPGADRRSKTKNRPKLEIMHDVQIAGGLMLGHCIQLERGNRVQTQVFGVAPYEPLSQERKPPTACARLPGDAGIVTAPVLSDYPRLYLFAGPSLAAGEPSGDLMVVYTGLELPANARAGQVRTINGAVVLNERAQATGVKVVNGAVVLKAGAIVKGPVEVRNGPLVLNQNSVIEGPVTLYNGYIQLQPGARIDGLTTFYGQALIAQKGAQLGDVRIARLDDQPAEGKRQRPSLNLVEGSAIRGRLQLDRPTKIKVAHGPAPNSEGVTPEVKVVRPDRIR